MFHMPGRSAGPTSKASGRSPWPPSFCTTPAFSIRRLRRRRRVFRHIRLSHHQDYRSRSPARRVHLGGVLSAGEIRRIFWPSSATFAISLAFAWLLLLPDELVSFGKSLMASAAFISNIFFRGQIGYFDGASEDKPLLHVWSLAVEEQFYIFWPLLLVAIYKMAGERRKIALCAILFGASLLYSEYLVRHTPHAAFYLLPSRAWELALGALLTISVKFGRLHLMPRRAADAASIAGIALICLTILTYDLITPFPGFSALLPCAGAALVIGAGESGTTLGGRLLSLPPIALIGRISYSLYLWHWPILVFAQIYLARVLHSGETYWALSLTLLVAYLSWRYVEEPFRTMRVAALGARESLAAALPRELPPSVLARCLSPTRVSPAGFDRPPRDHECESGGQGLSIVAMPNARGGFAAGGRMPSRETFTRKQL